MSVAIAYLVWRCSAIGFAGDLLSESVFGGWSRLETRARVSAVRECKRFGLRDCRVDECWSYDPRE